MRVRSCEVCPFHDTHVTKRMTKKQYAVAWMLSSELFSVYNFLSIYPSLFCISLSLAVSWGHGNILLGIRPNLACMDNNVLAHLDANSILHWSGSSAGVVGTLHFDRHIRKPADNGNSISVSCVFCRTYCLCQAYFGPAPSFDCLLGVSYFLVPDLVLTFASAWSLISPLGEHTGQLENCVLALDGKISMTHLFGFLTLFYNSSSDIFSSTGKKLSRTVPNLTLHLKGWMTSYIRYLFLHSSNKAPFSF